MDWHDVLNRMAGLTAPFLSSGRTGAAESALQAGAVRRVPEQARQALMKELSRAATRLELISASEQLRRQHAALLAQPELTSAELEQLGVLSGTALALSAEALGQALSEQELFEHAVTQIGPWLGRAAECGLLRAAEAGRELLGRAEQEMGARMSRS